MAELTVRPVALEETRSLRRSVLRPHQTLQELASHEPPEAFAAGAFQGQELIGVGLIGRDGAPGAWRVRGMATVPQARGRGAGTAILDELVRHAREQGAANVWASVRPPARSLYERAGFRQTSEVFDVPRIGPHVMMSLDL